MEYFNKNITIMQIENSKKILYMTVPKNVNLIWGEDYIKVSGPLGTLVKKKGDMDLILKDSILYIITEEKLSAFYWSLMKSLILGVLKGFKFKLKLIGVGYKAKVLDNTLFLKIGYSHEAVYNIPNDVNIVNSKAKGVLLLLKGKEEHRVRQVAMEIRSLRKPDVYKGKGIHKENEVLKLKKGKREGK